MSFLDTARGAISAAVSGASSWLSVAGAALGLGKAIAEDIGKAQDAAKAKQERDDGAQAQLNTDLTAEVKASQDALQAAINTDPQSVTDSLRNGRF